MCARFSSASILFVVLTCFSTLTGVSPLKLVKRSPEHIHVSSGYTNVTFTCKTDDPISACQFRWRNEIRKRSGPILDLSEGLHSQMNESYLNKDVLWYHYSGEGLDEGQCGVTLYIKGVKQYTVACRVRANNTGWKYGLMTLYAENYAEVPLKVSSMQEVAVGEEFSLMCKASKKLSTCRFYLPGFGVVMMDYGRESPSPSTHHYYGAGLDQGECGITIKAKEVNSGLVTCTVDTSRRDLEWNTIPLIVKRPPDRLKLEVTTPTTSDEHAIFHAKCTASGSRPAPTLTWLLDDQVLREDDEDDDVNATWTWPYQPQTLTQVLEIRVQRGGQAQRLTCIATHPDLMEPLEESQLLAFDSTRCSVEKSEAVAMTCELHGEGVSCLNATVGTVQRMSCKPGYVAKDNHGNDTRHCQQGGAWDMEVMKCVPDCGRLLHQSNETIEEKDTLSGATFPWHVGIYEQNDDNYKYLCGGSLISTKFVISGAQRFWDGDNRQKKDPAVLGVVTGKVTREWLQADDPLVQRRKVSKIDFHDRFSGFDGQFKYDIALLRLSSPVQVTESVNVVCIDWEGHWEKTQLRDNNTGMLVVGHGVTEDGPMADNLSYVNLTFVQNSTCFAQLSEDYQQYLTEDKFCARSEDGKVCPEDVGESLVFPEPTSGKFYVRGISSVGYFNDTEGTCHQQYYIMFTSVACYVDWINSVTRLFPSIHHSP